MKRKLLILILFVLPSLTQAQVLLTEDFNYGSTAGDLKAVTSVWVNNGSLPGTYPNGTSAAQPLYKITGLTYTDYSSPGIGGGIGLQQNKYYNVTRPLSESQTSGSIYASFLINVSVISTSTSGDYFFTLLNGTSYIARVYFRKLSDLTLAFGVSKAGSGTTPYASAPVAFNTTYLIVVKYTFNSGTDDDVVSLFINPTLPFTTEPTPDVTNNVGTDASSLSGIVAIQKGANTPNSTLDHIVVSKSWAGLTTLPISLSSFTAKAIDKTVRLNWSTASEINNNYFDLQHSADGKTFSTIANVTGAGTTNTSKDYSFIDENPNAGANYYQLVQHDFDGKTSSSNVISVDSKIEAAQLSVYANSLNVQVTLSSPNTTKGNIQLFDISGRKLQQLAVETVKGFNSFVLPTALQNGMYVIRYTADGVNINQKFVK